MPLPPVNPIPVPVPPTPPPVTTFWKNLPHYMQVFGTALIPFGAWVQSKVLTDPIFVQDFGSMANLPGIIAMISGVLINFSSVFVVKSNDKATDKIVEHTEEKVKLIETTAVSLIDDAANAPATIPQGKDPVRFRLKLALAEAVDADNDDLVDGIRLLLRKKAGAA